MNGATRKADAQDLLDETRADTIRQGRIALLEVLLENGECSPDEIRERVVVPYGINPSLFGCVPGPFVRKGVIKRLGFESSRRPQRHAAPQSVWELVDDAQAVDLLAEYRKVDQHRNQQHKKEAARCSERQEVKL